MTFVPYHLGKRSAAARIAAELVGTVAAAESVFTNDSSNGGPT